MSAKAESEWLKNTLSLPHNHSALFDLVQKASEHRLFVESSIVAETILVQIGLQIVTAHVVIHAPNSAFHQRPESFDGLRVNVASNVDFLGVLNAAMIVIVRSSGKSVIGRILIGEHKVGWQNVFFNQSMQGALGHIGRNECADIALALDKSNYRSFCFLVCCARTALHSLATAKIHLIHFDGLLAAAKFRRVLGFIEHGANLLKHAPRGFVRNARLALDLFCGNAATGRGHKVDRIKPSRERSGRLVKDRARSRVNVVAAMIARVGRTALDAVMFGDRFACLAIDTFRVEAIAKPLKAGGIVRELFLKVFQRVGQHVRLAVVVRHLVTYSQVKYYQMSVPTVKG